MEFLEDKQYLRREDCNVPIFAFPYYAVRFTLGGLSPPGQRGETMTSERSRVWRSFVGPNLVYLPLFIIRIHSAMFVFGFVAFR
jgi:hypothetical protein